jgi:lysozyme
MTSTALDTVRADLLRDEGLRLAAYQDALGYWTIGVGRLIDARRGGGLTEDEALYLLTNDIRRVRADLQRVVGTFDTLNDVRQNVLINMTFHLGLAGLLGFRQMLAALERRDYLATAREMLHSRWATQVPDRAFRLARQMATGVTA